MMFIAENEPHRIDKHFQCWVHQILVLVVDKIYWRSSNIRYSALMYCSFSNYCQLSIPILLTKMKIKPGADG